VLIREVKPSDFDDVIETFFSFFPEIDADPSFGLVLRREQPSIADEHKWFSDALNGIKAGNLVLVVAEVDSKVVGWCDVGRKYPGRPVDHRGVLGICIKKEFRDKGVGKALMKEAIEKSRGKFESIELGVFSSNLRAIRLYEKFGFKKIGHIPNAIKRAGKYFDEEVMYLELGISDAI
jgi:ribosomal protein S18 acetylase RimI-like enzyme